MKPRDIGLALAWVRAHIGLFGGDPDRVFLMGHSAGASHVASYVAAPDVRLGAVAGVLLLLGLVMLFLVGRLVRRGWRRWKQKEPFHQVA